MKKKFGKFLDDLYDICEKNIESCWLTNVVSEEFKELSNMTHVYLDENKELTDAQIEQLIDLKSIFDTNTKVDWMESDPKEEFFYIGGILDEIDL